MGDSEAIRLKRLAAKAPGWIQRIGTGKPAGKALGRFGAAGPAFRIDPDTGEMTEIRRRRKPKINLPPKVSDIDRVADRELSRLRLEVLRESDGHCSVCRRSEADGANIDVGCVKSIQRHPDLRFEKSNFYVVCRECKLARGQDETDPLTTQKRWRQLRLEAVEQPGSANIEYVGLCGIRLLL